MVHIKKVDIFGFKSFGFKNTTVNFEPGLVSISGPNGSGKSTLANVIAGRPGYSVTEGEIIYEGDNILAKEPEIRARAGIFLAFQYPVELPGVRTWQFLKAAVDAIRKENGDEEMGVRDFDKLLE